MKLNEINTDEIEMQLGEQNGSFFDDVIYVPMSPSELHSIMTKQREAIQDSDGILFISVWLPFYKRLESIQIMYNERRGEKSKEEKENKK